MSFSIHATVVADDGVMPDILKNHLIKTYDAECNITRCGCDDYDCSNLVEVYKFSSTNKMFRDPLIQQLIKMAYDETIRMRYITPEISDEVVFTPEQPQGTPPEIIKPITGASLAPEVRERILSRIKNRKGEK